MSTSSWQQAAGVAPQLSARKKRTPLYVKSQIFLVIAAIAALTPVLWAIYVSLRPKEYTDLHGFFSFGGGLSLDNYTQAFKDASFGTAFVNSIIITVPAVLIVIAMSSMVAFAVSRFTWKCNVTILILFTAGNMLPPQILATPIYIMMKTIQVPLSVSDSGTLLNTYIAVIAMNVAFQMGFCTFVLANFMKALPGDLTEAALVDGASVWRQYWQIIMPLCRPAIAALLTLQVIWVYNDFFWALLLIQRGDRLPITTAINNLQGLFVTNFNLIAAGAIITLIPTLIVYLLLQRHFVAGLTLGGSKG